MDKLWLGFGVKGTCSLSFLGTVSTGGLQEDAKGWRGQQDWSCCITNRWRAQPLSPYRTPASAAGLQTCPTSLAELPLAFSQPCLARSRGSQLWACCCHPPTSPVVPGDSSAARRLVPEGYIAWGTCIPPGSVWTCLSGATSTWRMGPSHVREPEARQGWPWFDFGPTRGFLHQAWLLSAFSHPYRCCTYTKSY